MTHDPTFWLLARASGLTAYGLLTSAVLAGLLLKARPFGAAVKPATAVEVHKSTSVLALGALAVHGTALVLDTTVRVTLPALLVPGLVAYRPLWTGVGVVTSELMALLIASFWLRRIIGNRRWRRLHWATYAAFAGATAHGLLAGSDSGRAWAQAIYVGAIAAVVAATAWRILVPPPRAARRTETASAAERRRAELAART